MICELFAQVLVQVYAPCGLDVSIDMSIKLHHIGLNLKFLRGSMYIVQLAYTISTTLEIICYEFEIYSTHNCLSSLKYL